MTETARRTREAGAALPHERRDPERLGTAAVVPASTSVTSIRSLGRRRVRTVVASTLGNAPAFRSRYCDSPITVPSRDDDLLGYGNVLVSLAARPDVRTILPLHEADAYLLAKYRATFAEHVATPWVSLDALRTVHDRYRLAAAAEAVGVPVPETRLLTEVEDWTPPQLIKPRYSLLTGEYVESLSPNDGVRSRARRFLDAGDAPDVAAVRDEMGHVPVVQEFVPVAREFGFGAICDDGDVLATFQHEKHRDHRYSGGASVFRESVSVPEVAALGRRLLDALDWHGIAQVQLMENAETGDLVLTEVNPRFWGSLSCAVRAGADFPYYYWLLAAGEPERIQPGYEVGVATHSLSGEVRHLLSIVRDDEDSPVERPSLARSMRDIAISTLRHPNFDEFSVTDPGPFLGRLRNQLLG
jgi:predicted ATP-grasp superfamily ATP-dependent carboligase